MIALRLLSWRWEYEWREGNGWGGGGSTTIELFVVLICSISTLYKLCLIHLLYTTVQPQYTSNTSIILSCTSTSYITITGILIYSLFMYDLLLHYY